MLHFHTQSQHRYQSVNKGVSLLIAVIILGSALLIVGASALVIGLGAREGGYTMQRGGEAFAVADGCMEEAYLRIRRDASWGLSDAVLFTAPNGSCSIQVSDLGGSMRRIDVTAQSAEYTKHIRSQYSIGSAIPVIVSWEERSD